MKLRISLPIICTLFLTTSIGFGYQATFTPRLNAGADYSDNIYRTKENKQEDTITTVSVGGFLDITGQTNGLTLSYDPTYAVYSNNTRNDTWRHYASANGWWDITKNTRLDLTDQLTVSEDPANDEEWDPTYRRGRGLYTRNTTNVNLGHKFGPEDTFRLGYSLSIFKNDEDIYEDSSRQNPYAAVTWWFVPNSYGIDLGADFTRGEFDRSDNLDSYRGNVRLRKRITRNFDAFLQFVYMKTEFEGLTENYEGYDSGVGFNYIVSEDTGLTLVVSYVRRNREVSEDQDGVIVTGNINTKWDWPRGRISLIGSSGYNQNTFGSENRGFNLYSTIEGDALYRFTRYINGNIFAGYRYNQYIDFDPERTDDRIWVGTGLTWQALQWMQLTMRYTYRTFNSSDEGFREYDENRVFFGVTLSPAQPYRIK